MIVWCAIAETTAAEFRRWSKRLGFLPLRARPWTFHDGWTEEWCGPAGETTAWGEATWLGRAAVVVVAPADEAVRRARAAISFPIRGVDTLAVASWSTLSVHARLDRLLDAAALAPCADRSDMQAILAVFQAGLDDHDAAVRIAAARCCYALSVEDAAQLLAGRTDADNPGIAVWARRYRELAERGG